MTERSPVRIQLGTFSLCVCMRVCVRVVRSSIKRLKMNKYGNHMFNYVFLTDYSDCFMTLIVLFCFLIPQMYKQVVVLSKHYCVSGDIDLPAVRSLFVLFVRVCKCEFTKFL